MNGKKHVRRRAARKAERNRRRARHRPHRSGGEPLRRHEVARLLRNARRHADHGRASANWKRSRSTRTRCTTSSSWRSITPRWSTTACGSRRCARRWMRSSTSVSETTTGEVTLRLYKGNLEPVSRKSPYSLYSLDIASFTMGADYDQKDARGFINLIGLPMQGAGAAPDARQSRSQMKLWGGRFETGPSEIFERFSGSLAFRPAAARCGYPRLAGLRARARARRHSDRRRARRDRRGLRRDPRRMPLARILRRRDRRRRPHARHPQAEGARRRAWPTRSTPAAAATSRSRSIRGSGCARNATASRALLRGVMDALLDLAEKYPDAVIPGYTHMRRAQAVLWPHYLLAYFEMFARDCGALRRSPPPRQRAAARLGRAGRQRLPLRPRSDRARSGLRRASRATAWMSPPTAISRSIFSTPPP